MKQLTPETQRELVEALSYAEPLVEDIVAADVCDGEDCDIDGRDELCAHHQCQASGCVWLKLRNLKDALAKARAEMGEGGE